MGVVVILWLAIELSHICPRHILSACRLSVCHVPQMLGAEEVPAKFNESRRDFYEVLETNSLSFTIANFDDETWQIGTLNKSKNWNPPTKLWFKFEATSQEEKRKRNLEKSFKLEELTLKDYGTWWGLAKAGMCGIIDVSHHTSCHSYCHSYCLP
jgi:hypothetical protein